MTARLAITALALALGMAASGASAQSYNAPAGIPAATAPGGLQGRAALPNLFEDRDGRAVYAPRRAYDGDVTTGSVRDVERRGR